MGNRFNRAIPDVVNEENNDLDAEDSEESAPHSVSAAEGRQSRKRPFSQSSGNSFSLDNMDENNIVRSPKKLCCTLDFVYEELYLNGEGSDITVVALGKEWKLHRLYMKQSNFFNSMFNENNWLERETDKLELPIPDEIINQEALHVIFGALYKDNIELRLDNVVPTLAAASYFDMVSMLALCQDLMIKNINYDTAVQYYEAASSYCPRGDLHRACGAWLRLHLVCGWHRRYALRIAASAAADGDHPDAVAAVQALAEEENKLAKFLRPITPDLMAKLVSSSSTLIVQVEMDLFDLLCSWLYVREINPNWTPCYSIESLKTRGGCGGLPADENSGLFSSNRSLKDAAYHFFSKRDCNQANYLDLDAAEPYRPAFLALRLQHMVSELGPTRVLTALRLMPASSLDVVCRRQWLQLLAVERGDDVGPTVEAVPRQVFLSTAARCSRYLEHPANYLWRWTGFGFGLDVLFQYQTQQRQLVVMRNVHRQATATSIDLCRTRNLMLRVGVLCLQRNQEQQSPDRSVTGTDELIIDRDKVQYSDILCFTLGRDKSEVVLTLRPELSFPLFVRCDILPYTPLSEQVSDSENQQQQQDADDEEECAPSLDDTMYEAHQQGDVVVIN